MASVVPSTGSGRRRNGQHGHYPPQSKNLPWPLSATSSAMDNNDRNDWILPESEWVNPARSRDFDAGSIRFTDAILMEHQKPASVEPAEVAPNFFSNPDKEEQDYRPRRNIVHFSERDTNTPVVNSLAGHRVPEFVSTQEERVASVVPEVLATSTRTDDNDESIAPNDSVIVNDEVSISSESIATTDGVVSGVTDAFTAASTAGSATQSSWVPKSDPEKKIDEEVEEEEQKEAVWPSEEYQKDQSLLRWSEISAANSQEETTSLEQGDDQGSSNNKDSWMPPDVRRSIEAKKRKEQKAREMSLVLSSETEGWVPLGEKHKSSHAAELAPSRSARIDFTGVVRSDSSHFKWVPDTSEIFETSSSNDEQGSVTERVHSRSAPASNTSSAFDVASSSENSSEESNYSDGERDQVGAAYGGGAPRFFNEETDDQDESDGFDSEHDPAAAGLASLTAALHSATNGRASHEYGVDQEQPSGLADPEEMEEQRPPPPPAPDGKSAPQSRTPRNSKTPRSSRLMKAIVFILILLVPSAVVVIVYLLILDDGGSGNNNADRDVESVESSPQTLSPTTPTILSPPLETPKPPGSDQTKPPVFAPPPTQKPVFPPTRAPTMPTSPPTLLPMSPTSDALIQLLSSVAADGGAALRDRSSPQYRAMQWIRTRDNAGIFEDRIFLQRYALAALYYSTNGEGWIRTGSWLTAANECDWLSFSEFDIPACDSAGNVIYMDLAENNLSGPLPPDLALLARTLGEYCRRPPRKSIWCIQSLILAVIQFVVNLTLSGNKINGRLPVAYSRLSNLSALKLSRNQLAGSIPTQYSSLTELSE
jgi:hypothetical protein